MQFALLSRCRPRTWMGSTWCLGTWWRAWTWCTRLRRWAAAAGSPAPWSPSGPRDSSRTRSPDICAMLVGSAGAGLMQALGGNKGGSVSYRGPIHLHVCDLERMTPWQTL